MIILYFQLISYTLNSVFNELFVHVPLQFLLSIWKGFYYIIAFLKTLSNFIGQAQCIMRTNVSAETIILSISFDMERSTRCICVEKDKVRETDLAR